MKELGVIILNWNGLGLLQEFLPTAAEFTIDDHADLIVADNGSSDASCQWVEENFPEVRLLRFPENYGFAEGYNRAIAQTRYRYTVLLNSDVEVTPGWTHPLLDFMTANPNAGACQPKIRSQLHKGMFEYAGAAGGYLDKHGYPYCRGRLFSSIEEDYGQYDSQGPVAVTWASGAALMVDTELYLRLGGLDPAFFAHMEEIDLCVRMQRYGHQVYCVPDSMVYHVGGASLNQGNPRKTYLNFRNNLLLLHKNSPRRSGRRLLFVRRLMDALAWGAFIAKGDFAGAKAIVKAHADFRKMRRNYTDFPDREFLSTLPGARRNIITDYYLLGKRL